MLRQEIHCWRGLWHFCDAGFFLLWMNVCFCCVRFCFSILSQQVGWEELSKMTWAYFMSGVTQNLNSLNQFIRHLFQNNWKKNMTEEGIWKTSTEMEMVVVAVAVA